MQPSPGAMQPLTWNRPQGVPLEVGKGRVLRGGTDVALLGYGSAVQSCLAAAAALAERGVRLWRCIAPAFVFPSLPLSLHPSLPQ